MSANQDAQQLAAATELVVGTQFGSITMLQRHLGTSRARATALMETLEEHGVVGPFNDNRARDVLIRPDRLREAIASVLGRDLDDPTNHEGEPRP